LLNKLRKEEIKMKNIILFALFLLTIGVYADYIKNGNTVVDIKRGLMWQDNNDSKYVTKSWIDAINYCEDLVLDGYDDWRLPNINELYSVGSKHKVNPSIHKEFENIKISTYWSSTSRYSNSSTGYAWTVEFSDANDNEDKISKLHNIRCVRNCLK
jgi:hypothetical protein